MSEEVEFPRSGYAIERDLTPLETAPLAYENQDFLDSPDGRHDAHHGRVP